MKKIKVYFVKKWRLLKLNSVNPYIEEFTVFINVKIDSLNEFSNSMPLKLNNEVKISRERININIVKKYLLISLKSKLILVNINLFIKTFFGLLNERIWLIENLNKE